MTALEYDITKMTGCLYGNVPDIGVHEALTYDGLIKAVHKELAYPVYGHVVAVDFTLNSFTLELENSLIEGLLIEDYVLIPANTINPVIPKTLGSAIIVNDEIFNVVSVNPVPVWVGDNSLVYYCEDIQALTDTYGYTNLL